MKTASILLLLVFVLGFVSEAEATTLDERPTHDYTVKIGETTFGFEDYSRTLPNGEFNLMSSRVHFGPFGPQAVPFTAPQGLIGFCCVLATLIILPVVLTFRWKKRAKG